MNTIGSSRKPPAKRERYLAPQLQLNRSHPGTKPQAESSSPNFQIICLALALALLALMMTGCSSGPPARLDCPEAYLVVPETKLPVPKDKSKGATLVAVKQTHDMYYELRRQHIGLIRCVRVYQDQAGPPPE